MSSKQIDKSILTQNPRDLKGKDREDWIKAKQNEVLDKVRSYTESPEDMMQLVEFMAQFHNYSLNNTLLIKEQWTGAYAVASLKTWNKLGYMIKDGEKGSIFIWVRMKYKIIYLEDGREVQWYRATKTQKARALRGELDYDEGTTYKPGIVYDITQTNCPPEDYPNVFPNRRVQFNDSEVDYENLLGGLDNLANKIGVELFFDKHNFLGNAKGAYYRDRHNILLNPRNTRSENISVTIHELAHAYMHEKTKDEKHVKELQAELVATVVSSAFNLDTSKESIGYLAHYTENGDKMDGKYKDVTEILKEVQKTVKLFVSTINKEIS